MLSGIKDTIKYSWEFRRERDSFQPWGIKGKESRRIKGDFLKEVAFAHGFERIIRI